MKKKRKIPVSKIFVYFILAGMGFVYLYPVLYMIVNSFLSAGDLTDPSVTWIPTELCFDNFRTAFETLDFFKSFGMSMLMSLRFFTKEKLKASTVRKPYGCYCLWIGEVSYTI